MDSTDIMESTPDTPPSRLGEYFANLPDDEIVDELIARTRSYYKYLRDTGRLSRMERSYRYYFGLDERGMDAAYIKRAGSQGELHSLRVNHYRSLNQSLLTLTTSQPPVSEVRAVNTDWEAQTQTILGQALLDFYLKEKSLGRALKDACEFSLWANEGFLYAPWDESLGDEYAVDPTTKKVVRKGDIRYEAKHPVDVIRDARARNSEFKWCIVRGWENRYDLAAQNPDLEEEILGVARGKDTGTDAESFLIDMQLGDHDTDDTDLVPTYEFFHADTSACRGGRYIKYVGDVLLDSSTLEDLQYDSIPCFRMAANESTFTPFGHSNSMDLLGIQEAIDTLYSTALTNQSTFGVQHIWVKKGSGFGSKDLSTGLTLLESDEEPKAINLTQTPVELFNFIKQLEEALQVLSGINSVVRGQPDANLKSGAALALVASQAVQFASNIAAAYEACFEFVGTHTFKILQRRATVPRMLAIVGKFNRSYLESFSSAKIDKIAKVVVDRGNPLTKTAAGRIELANTLLQNQLVKTAEEYLIVLQTGRLEPLIEGATAELLNIRAENEALKKGETVIAIRKDNHDLHIAEHQAIISSPEARKNPVLLKNALDHIADHEDQKVLEAQRQAQLAARAQQPPSPPTGAPPPVGAPPPPAPQGPEPAAPAAVMDAQNPITQAAQAVRMPSMPKDALTGQPYQPALQG